MGVIKTIVVTYDDNEPYIQLLNNVNLSGFIHLSS